MDNNEKYLQVFTKALDVERAEAETMRYHGTRNWDSVGHMSLVSELENAFDIMMGTDDIISFDSFEKGKQILSENYGIRF